MSKNVKRVMSLILSAVMLMTSIIVVNIATSTVSAATSPYVLEQNGWLESAYVEWTSVSGASGYAAYVKEASAADSAYERLDNELIRKYPDCFRADALGLKAGSYVIKVVPAFDGKLDESKAFTSDTLNVIAHDRSGFAFSSQSTNKTASGGYNDDGTVPSNAQIIYITEETKDSVALDVITNDKGAVTHSVGFAAIMESRQKGYDKTPLIVRMVGQVTSPKGINSSGYIQVKGCYNVTIEGVGDDATCSGWSYLVRDANNVEIRNIGFMGFQDDGVSIDTDNYNIWIHNNEFFYGKRGSGDKIKGDGSLDSKGFDYVTVSYNHFYDSGKCNLCGMGESAGHITYHHNWFDYSDSRHPRVRKHTVHSYNNYFDHNSKYGVGVTTGSSAFVENNYFDNCKHPMLISMQGSDLMGGSGYSNNNATFSKEAGGMIKAYNNVIVGSNAIEMGTGTEPIYYGSSDTTDSTQHFDAYLATSRDEKVPATVTALSGGSKYNNFDTDSSMYSYTPDAPEDVPAKVKMYAGRVMGGDFFETIGKPKTSFKAFTDANYDGGDHAIDDDLASAVSGYKTKLIEVGGMESGGEVEERTTVTEASTQATTQTVETSTQTTTQAAPSINTKPVDTGAAEDNSGEDGGKVSVTYDSATDKYTLKDSSSTLAATLNIPTKETIKSGKVVVRGTVTPVVTKAAGSWALVSVTGPKAADGTYPEIAAFASNGDKALTLRVNNDKDHGLSSKTIAFTPNKEYSYEFLFDLDAKTVTLTVDGTTIENIAPLTSTEIGGWATITAKSATDRGIVASTPYIGVVSDEPVITESSTQSTTTTTTDTTTTTTEPSTQGTTSQPPTPAGDKEVYGNADNSSDGVELPDVVEMFDYVLGNVITQKDGGVIDSTNIESSGWMKWLDVHEDGKIDSADVAEILQKVLNSSYEMLVERNHPQN